MGPAAHLWSRSSLRPEDVDVAELYDGFTFNCLSWIEALGFCGIGEAGDFLADPPRSPSGASYPLNTFGGQLSAGRTHGYGFLHEAVVQLRGDGGERQVEGAEVAVVSTGGGTPGGCFLFTSGRLTGAVRTGPAPRRPGPGGPRWRACPSPLRSAPRRCAARGPGRPVQCHLEVVEAPEGTDSAPAPPTPPAGRRRPGPASGPAWSSRKDSPWSRATASHGAPASCRVATVSANRTRASAVSSSSGPGAPRTGAGRGQLRGQWALHRGILTRVGGMTAPCRVDVGPDDAPERRRSPRRRRPSVGDPAWLHDTTRRTGPAHCVVGTLRPTGDPAPPGPAAPRSSRRGRGPGSPLTNVAT